MPAETYLELSSPYSSPSSVTSGGEEGWGSYSAPALAHPHSAHRNHADSLFGIIHKQGDVAPTRDITSGAGNDCQGSETPRGHQQLHNWPYFNPDTLCETPSLKDGLTHVHQGKSIESSSRNSQSGSLPKTSPSRADCYWFAQSGEYFIENSNDTGLDDSKEKDKLLDTEERLRVIRERQAEERQRKLKDLKLTAFQAQRYREQQEEDRRRKIEEIKFKENERRHQVEERKRQIFDAEMDRRESLVRRSHDREARIEAQRNAHRTSIGFAFGSSTPRLLDSDPTFTFNSRRIASQVLLYHPSSSSQTRSLASNSAPNGTSSKDNEGVVRRRFGAGHTVDRGIEPVNAAHRHTIHESFFYGTPESLKSFSAINNPIAKPIIVSDETVHIRHSGFPWEIAEQQNLYTTNPDDNRMSGLLHGSGVLVGDIMTQSFTSISTYNRGRRRTDLIPTIPIHKDNPRTRSPGRAYSMTRLDQLSQPRAKRPLQALREEERITKTKSMANLSGGKRHGARGLKAPKLADSRMSKSTSHLAATPTHKIPHQRLPLSVQASPTRTLPSTSGSSSPGRGIRGLSPEQEIRKIKRLSQSMWQLSSTGGPRPTKSSILRRDALASSNQPGLNRSMLLSKNSGSQVNGGDVGGSISSRAASSPSRPQSSMSQQSLSSTSNSSVNLRAKPTPRKSRPLSVAGSTFDRNNIDQKQAGVPPTGRPPRAKSAGPDNALKEIKSENSSPTPPVPATRRHPTSKTNNINSTSDKPKIAPKPNLQKSSKTNTPQSSPTREQSSPSPNEIKAESNKNKVIEAVNLPHVDEPNSKENLLTNGLGNIKEQLIIDMKETNNEEIKIEDSATVIPPKPKITTEEEAKAILAEKRRQAREQAEREAELERLRQEELKRLEEERLRREEEEQRLWEEEVERQRKVEEERLQKAIEEQQKKEEEERLRREEEVKLKIEREKAEQQAREEQERLRKEAEEKFAREEEERAKRRKRVEDIMSRTRARDKAKKELEGQTQSPTQNDDLTNSFTESLINSEISQPETDQDLLSNQEQKESSINNGQNNGLETPEESLLDLKTIHINGFNTNHQFHVNIEKDYHSHTGGESILDSQCLSGFDLMNPAKILNNATSNYISPNSTNNISNMGDHLSNEDNVNFNIMTSTNGINNYPNHQDAGVTDLLS